MQDLTLVMAQLDPLVGDIPGNAERAIEAVREARIEHGADIVVFPELFLSGYPPEDLLLRPSMETRLREARSRMAAKMSAQWYASYGDGIPEGFEQAFIDAVEEGGTVGARARTVIRSGE